MTNYDLIIIGGGAAGMMAAISARRHHPGLTIAIIDRTFAPGRKILVCGAGRCNITNINLHDQIRERYYGAPLEFITEVFSEFGYEQIVEFFNDLGIELYVERKTDIGKLFPVTNQASTVSTLMLDEIERAGIELYLNTEVGEIIPIPGEGFELHAKKFDPDTKEVSEVNFSAKRLILSAGGKTYPALGSNGSGYQLAESLGHSIIDPVPSALPLEAKNPLSQLVQGLKFEVEVTSLINDQPVKTRTDDVMFTQYGLSGPAILNISREISIHINREHLDSAQVSLNFFPGKSREEVEELLNSRWERRPEQTVEYSLFGLLPNKLAGAVLDVAGIPATRTAGELTGQGSDDRELGGQERTRLLDILTSYIVKVTATRGWNEAEFTAGGINTDEVVPGSLESRIVPGLYFAGEVLNVDGDVGGFNLSWSWSSGWVAGKLAG